MNARTHPLARGLAWLTAVTSSGVLAAVMFMPGVSYAGQRHSHTWDVSAAAPAGGNGNAQAPFSPPVLL